MLDALREATAGGAFRPLDLYFAAHLQALSGRESPELLVAAGLVSRELGVGHVCIDLRAYAGRPVPDVDGEPIAGLGPTPDIGVWRSRLRDSPMVGGAGEQTPLVLDHNDRLYLARYWFYEQDLAERLRGRSGRADLPVDSALLRSGIDRLFRPVAGASTDWQRVAAALAVLRPLVVISGGPGTGKTFTVARILALLLEQAEDTPLEVALAAPTGKAADRMSESIARAKAAMPCAERIRQAIPDQASTLHRLLGAHPGTTKRTYHEDNPLPLDVLVIDEASMIDLALMHHVVTALPERCRLILLGDKDQLVSVEAGFVLGDICGAPGQAEDFTQDLARKLSQASGQAFSARGRASPLSDAIAVLSESHRFGEASDIGTLARSVLSGDGAGAMRLLADPARPGVELRDPDREADWRRELSECVAVYVGFSAMDDVSQALAALGRFRVLCALRRGPRGVEGLNRALELGVTEILERARDPEHYHGRPILITRNDPAQGLYNGDVGILWRETARDPLRACFPGHGDQASRVRDLAPERLPGHVSAYAMTVHKSQGSEFDTVRFVLPGRPSRILTRELVYTAITRARRSVVIVGGGAVLEQAIFRRNPRLSGLRERLWG